MSKLGLPDNQHWSAKLQKRQRQIARVGEDGRASYCCDDGIDQIVNVKKPEEKHEGKILQKKRAKWFAHVFHNIHQFLQIAIIGLPWWNIFSSVLLFFSGGAISSDLYRTYISVSKLNLINILAIIGDSGSFMGHIDRVI